jgi:hypothetical protein
MSREMLGPIAKAWNENQKQASILILLLINAVSWDSHFTF